MNGDEFVRAVRKVVLDAAVDGRASLLWKPPGLSPPPHLVAASQWFRAQPEASRDMVLHIMRMVAHDAVFGFMAVLDGVRAIDDTGGELELTSRSDGIEMRINDPEDIPLHERLTDVVDD